MLILKISIKFLKIQIKECNISKVIKKLINKISYWLNKLLHLFFLIKKVEMIEK